MVSEHKEFIYLDERKSIGKYFEDIVETNPNKVILEEKANSFTYVTLNEKSNQLARYLKQLGVVRGEKVGIYLEPSVELIIAIIGILKIGGACVPIDPEYNDEKVKYILKDTKIKKVICNNKFLNLYSENVDVIPLESNFAFLEEFQNGNIKESININDLAFVFYTSGSTGKPKGVLITHAAVLNDTVPEHAMPPLSENDIFLMTSPVCTTRIIGEIFYPLFAKAKLVIINYKFLKNVSQIMGTIVRKKITVLFVVPTMLREMIKSGRLKECISLRCVQSMGEQLSPYILKEFFSQSIADLINIYGQTETGNCTMSIYSKEKSGEKISVGKNVINRKVWIVNDHNELVENGEVGKIIISGLYLAKGYLNDSHLTEKCFKNSNGIEYYITSDIGKINKNKELEYLGRSDEIVKLGGKRISLIEVKNALLKFPNVEDAIVGVQKNHREEQFLIAAVVYRGDESITYREWADYLINLLPKYAVPRKIVTLNKFPTKTNGKVDKEIIFKDIYREISDVKGFDNKIEKELATFWAEILEMTPECIDSRKTFVELGASSLAVAICCAEIEEKYGKELSMRDIMIYSLEELARMLE